MLFDKYHDNEIAANAGRDVESIKRRAENMGLAITFAAFGLNEVARLTLRSRKYLITLILPI